MTSRSLNSDIKPVKHILGTVTTTQTPSTGVDTLGFEAASIMVSIGTITNIANSPKPSWTFHVEESDTSNSGFTAITDSARIIRDSSAALVVAPNSITGVVLTVDAAAEDDAVYSFDVITDKRYIRVVATAANTPGSTAISVVVVLCRPTLTPTAH